MYRISDQQIDYILSDIGARGVEMESLQQNLLDHVCCIIENNLEENGDFESFYQKSIKTFYKDALWEIEEETLLLLTYKNYYTMKKVMITSGSFSAAAMIFGILFKFMHWPGASALIILGIGTSSLIFLPLLFVLKVKDRQQTKDKIILAFGILSGILLSLSILFKIMHWPYSMILGYSAVISLGLILLPLFFITGIKKPEEKINTVTMSIVMIMICGLWLSLIRSPKGTKALAIKNTTMFVINEQLVTNEKKQFNDLSKQDSTKSETNEIANQIVEICNQLKSSILFMETGVYEIPDDFENKDIYLNEGGSGLNEEEYPKVETLLSLIKKYNKKKEGNPLNKLLPKDYGRNNNYDPTIRLNYDSHLDVLNRLTQIQLLVLQNERTQ
jgi:hypothetical protein